jgi:hypothetical protein
MPQSDKEIWTAANQVIQQYEDAEFHASMRADELLEQGDVDGHLVWMRILKAIRSLTEIEPGERVH